MKPRQKLGLGIFLCLSVMMMMIAIIRISGYRYNGIGLSGSIDTTWAFFCLYLEACVAVIMASITAFRSLFIRGGSRTIERNKTQNPIHAIRQQISRRAVRPGWDEVSDEPRVSNIDTATAHNNGIETIIYHEDPSSTETTPPHAVQALLLG